MNTITIKTEKTEPNWYELSFQRSNVNEDISTVDSKIVQIVDSLEYLMKAIGIKTPEKIILLKKTDSIAYKNSLLKILNKEYNELIENKTSYEKIYADYIKTSFKNKVDNGTVEKIHKKNIGRINSEMSKIVKTLKQIEKITYDLNLRFREEELLLSQEIIKKIESFKHNRIESSFIENKDNNKNINNILEYLASGLGVPTNNVIEESYREDHDSGYSSTSIEWKVKNKLPRSGMYKNGDIFFDYYLGDINLKNKGYNHYLMMDYFEGNRVDIIKLLNSLKEIPEYTDSILVENVFLREKVAVKKVVSNGYDKEYRSYSPPTTYKNLNIQKRRYLIKGGINELERILKEIVSASQ